MSSLKILGVIPARYASTRFPAKALIPINGVTMIRRVYEQAVQAKLVKDIVVATDHEEIYNHVKDFGGKVVMTDTNHVSGTDRCREALELQQNEYDFVINIQGDEPFIQPAQIDLLAESLNQDTEIATLVKKIDNEQTLFNPNTPKVVFNEQMEAIYFSRQTIPFLRGVPVDDWLQKHAFYKHIGIYAYRKDILKAITKLKPSKLEMVESLEQLRWLEHGYKIQVKETPYETIGIDTPDDLLKVKSLSGL
ncbi:3-deoxy-manno-octulosonate cytidylyltransferase [Cytophagaceae bacterium ABcell3]|nr:3-deoxy-manno-octulosonate cytidylyltransferase [Cytophagaceae bacterium ABcell3]